MNNRLPVLVRLLVLVCAASAACSLRAAETPLEQGIAAFQRGALEDAAAHWAHAERAYADQGQVANRISALINLARAQSKLGQYRRASVTLGTALDLARTSGDARQTVSIGAALGNVHIALGPPETAERYLRDALAVARNVRMQR
jgi:tetratricopeptide (TPR) repeat protein